MLRIPVCVALSLLASCASRSTPTSRGVDIYPADHEAELNGLRMRLLRAERVGKQVTAAFQQIQASHGWLLVEMEWTNATRGPWDTTFTPTLGLFVNGSEYQADPLASGFFSVDRNGSALGAVNPGARRVAVALFDAPPGTSHLRVIVPERAQFNVFGNTVRGPFFFFDLGDANGPEVH